MTPTLPVERRARCPMAPRTVWRLILERLSPRHTQYRLWDPRGRRRLAWLLEPEKAAVTSRRRDDNTPHSVDFLVNGPPAFPGAQRGDWIPAAVLWGKGVRRVEIIPDGVDLSVVPPGANLGLRSRSGLSGSLVVAIAGHVTWYDTLGGGLGCALLGRRPIAVLPRAAAVGYSAAYAPLLPIQRDQIVRLAESRIATVAAAPRLFGRTPAPNGIRLEQAVFECVDRWSGGAPAFPEESGCGC